MLYGSYQHFNETYENDWKTQNFFISPERQAHLRAAPIIRSIITSDALQSFYSSSIIDHLPRTHGTIQY
jgi:hypothetical protein